MKTCPKCNREIEEAVPFCVRCEGYKAVTYLTSGNLLVVTYRKPNGKADDIPTLWSKE